MSSAAVRVQLLGGFEVRVDEDAVEIKPGPQRLLALLALAEAAVDRTFAAYQLWPEATRERAQANLRSTLWRLRDVPAEVVVASKTHLRLAPAVWVDVRQGLAELQRLRPGGHRGRAALRGDSAGRSAAGLVRRLAGQ